MIRRKKKPGKPAGISAKEPIVDGPRKLGLLNQAMPFIQERLGNDTKAAALVGAAESALAASKKIVEAPDLLEKYISQMDGGIDSRFEATLVFSFALSAGSGTEKALKGLERGLVDDDEAIRQMALETLVEHYWVSGNFNEIEMLLKIPQLLETVTACLWAASIRLDEKEVPAESRDYLRSMMLEQAGMGNRTAIMFIEEVRAMSGLD